VLSQHRSFSGRMVSSTVEPGSTPSGSDTSPALTTAQYLQSRRGVLGQGRRGRHGHVAQLAQEVGRLEVGEQQRAAAALAGARRAADAVDVLRLVGRQTQLLAGQGALLHSMPRNGHMETMFNS